MSNRPADDSPCPCGGYGGATTFATCCLAIHLAGAGLGKTAEQLMRARYSAHFIGDSQFVLESWHPDTRPPSLTLDGSLTWSGLAVVDTEAGGGLDARGVVEFVARYVSRGVEHQLHERSTFQRVGGSWLYVDGRRPGV